jgi:3D-(3,5/4)-trihydroxycyclohexane-1,2-dione acylhydrolase (decyclizing)
MSNGEPGIRLTVAQAVVRYLQVQHSERDGVRQRLIPAMFGIFGHGNVAGMSQALYEHGTELPYFQPCNEQSMVHTAAGYAKATGRRATFACCASIGPGSTNMVTGAALATINRLPVLLLPSDYYATRHQGPVLQQLEHPVSFDVSVNDCFRPVSRFFDRVTRPEQLLESLPEAMRVLTDPAETGAVTISLPQDVQSHAYVYPEAFFAPRVWEIERRPPVQARLRETLELLRAARRPCIVAGGGVHYSEAWDALAALAEAAGIPVGETFGGKGAFRGRRELALGGLGVNGSPAAGVVARDADLVICVGTRLTDFTTGSHSLFQAPDVKFVSINVSGHDAYKMGALPVVADARDALVALTGMVEEAGVRTDAGYREEVRAACAGWREVLERDVFAPDATVGFTQAQVLATLNRHTRPDDVVVAAAGSPPGDILQMWDCDGGAQAHLEFGFSCMGYEIPASLGVRLSGLDGEVFTFIGDGTYLMNPTELMTAVQENLKITVVLVRNSGYQCIRNLQLRSVGRDFGNEFRRREPEANRLAGEYLDVDFAQNAASFGVRTWSVDDARGLEAALDEARAHDGPCVIVADVARHAGGPPSGVWWDVAPAETSDDPQTRSAREDYDRGRELQRYYA